MNTRASESKTERDNGAAESRKPYVKPELVEYGDVIRLTETGGGSTSDGTGNRKRMR